MTFRSLAPTGALLIALLGAPLTGCDSGGSSSDPAMLRLDVEAMAGADAFQAGQPFTVNGTTGQLDIAQLYLSGITLLHEDGREISILADEPVTVRAQDENQTEIQHSVSERYVLVDADAGRTVATLGEVPAGRYTGVRFLLGVDGLDNRAAMEDFPAGHPLAAQASSMHWNWNAGYVFLRLDGLLDVDGDGVVDPATGTPGDAASGQWRLHVGGTANATTVTLDQAFESEPQCPMCRTLRCGRRLRSSGSGAVTTTSPSWSTISSAGSTRSSSTRLNCPTPRFVGGCWAASWCS